MTVRRTEALVLRAADFSNTSRVLALYTEDEGQVRVLAKGLRRRRELFAPMDLFSRNEVVYYPRRAPGLAILKESFELDAHRSLGASLGRLYAASAAAELMAEGTPLGEADRDLYALARSLFGRLARADALPAGGGARALLAAFVLRLLRRTGYGPVLDRCAECGKPLRPREARPGVPAYAPASGGLVCAVCRRTARPLVALGREVAEGLDRLDAAPVEAVWDVPLSAGAARRILAVLLAHARRFLEAPLDALGLAEERSGWDGAPGRRTA